MKNTTLTNTLLAIITAALVVIAARPFFVPRTVSAQNTQPYPFYIEPGTQMLRAPDGSKQIYGRVVIDMRTGQVWGFPTYTPDTYPVSAVSTKPQISHPFALGRFAFEDTDR